MITTFQAWKSRNTYEIQIKHTSIINTLQASQIWQGKCKVAKWFPLPAARLLGQVLMDVVQKKWDAQWEWVGMSVICCSSIFVFSNCQSPLPAVALWQTLEEKMSKCFVVFSVGWLYWQDSSWIGKANSKGACFGWKKMSECVVVCWLFSKWWQDGEGKARAMHDFLLQGVDFWDHWVFDNFSKMQVKWVFVG